MTAPTEIVMIGLVSFHDTSVHVYHDPLSSKGKIGSIWQMRNPSTCYVGYMYMDNSTGKLSYPEDAIIPEQTDRDREMMPKGIITGETEITEDFISYLMPRLESEYDWRNRIK